MARRSGRASDDGDYEDDEGEDGDEERDCVDDGGAEEQERQYELLRSRRQRSRCLYLSS